MIAELGGGTVKEAYASAQSYDLELPVVSITLERLNHVLGTSLTLDEVKQVFAQLEYPTTVEGTRFDVTIPAWRFDISIEADVVEEVGRIYGYDKIPTNFTNNLSTGGGLTDETRFIVTLDVNSCKGLDFHKRTHTH